LRQDAVTLVLITRSSARCARMLVAY